MSDLRQNALGESVNTEEYVADGETYKMKALTRKQMNDIREEADGSDLEVVDLMILKCTYYPDDYEDEDKRGEKVFERADLNAIKSAPNGGTVDQLGLGALHVNGLMVPDEEAEDDDKKN